ncbi:MAG: DinB family protein [Pyrinomonadaceae bacterium]
MQAELQTLIAFLAETPAVVQRLTTDLSVAEQRWQPAPAEFSALAQVCHLRDIEREGYTVRLRRLLAEDEPMLPDIDGGQLARERDYQSQDFNTARAAFADARRANVALVNTLAPAQLARAGTLAGVGQITIARLLELMRAHDEGHRAELQALSAALQARAVARVQEARPQA